MFSSSDFVCVFRVLPPSSACCELHLRVHELLVVTIIVVAPPRAPSLPQRGGFPARLPSSSFRRCDQLAQLSFFVQLSFRLRESILLPSVLDPIVLPLHRVSRFIPPLLGVKSRAIRINESWKPTNTQQALSKQERFPLMTNVCTQLPTASPSVKLHYVL